MASEFTILKQRGLVLIRHSGFLTFADSMAAFLAYHNHPDFHPAQNALVDFAPVTRYEHDPVRLIAFQAQMIDRLPPSFSTPPLLIFHAPAGSPGHPLAHAILKSWDGLGLRIPRITETEAEALDIAGQPERSFASLWAMAT